jgi:hypothetical protein
MTDRTDATFLLALIILTIIGLAVSSATHTVDAASSRHLMCKPGDSCGTRPFHLRK